MEMLEAVKIERKLKSIDQNIEELYVSAFPYVARFVSKMGGTYDDAKDIFQDALVIFLEVNFEKVNHAPNAYILGISKHLWIRKYNRSKASVSFTEMEKLIELPDDYFPTVDNKRLLRFLESAGKKCMNLLRVFYYQKAPMKTLIQDLGYSNEHSASVQKYKCLEKVREIVKEKSLTYEDFVE